MPNKKTADAKAKSPAPIKLRPNGSSGVKRGRLSREECKSIDKLIGQEKTIEEISLTLKRPVSQIQTYVRKFHGVGTDLPAKAPQVAEFTRQLRKSMHWKNLQNYYSKEDLEYYEELTRRLQLRFGEPMAPLSVTVPTYALPPQPWKRPGVKRPANAATSTPVTAMVLMRPK